MIPRKLKMSEVEFTITVLPEDIDPRGNASAINPDTDKEILDHIYANLDRGNVWAWCWVKVTAHWEGFEGSDTLGGCSYKSEAAFKRGGYYTDMKQAALDQLNAEVAAAANKISTYL